MPSIIDPTILERADQAGIRLEIVRGVPTWEAAPALRHQRAVDRIRATIKHRIPIGVCECLHVPDVYIRFPDGSLKRPDVSIFCSEPSEQDKAITAVPAAVIEVISQGYEAKDHLEAGPAFYLSQGVKDVVVFNPYANTTLHCTAAKTVDGPSPMTIELQCGCTLVA